LENDETFAVELSDPSGTVELGTAIAQATIQNDDFPTLSIAPTSVNEPDSGQTVEAELTVSLDRPAPLGFDVSVQYRTASGSASVGSDFTGIATQSLTIPGGFSSGTISVEVLGDDRAELDESFSVELFAPEQASLDAQADEATVTILEDDDRPELSIAQASLALPEGEETSQAIVDLQLSAPSVFEVSVDFAAVQIEAPNAARAGKDFTPVSDTLVIPPNTTEAQIAIPFIGDTEIERDEVFELRLSNASQAVIAPGSEVLQATIQNDDFPNLSVGSVEVVEGDAGTEQTLMFDLSLDAVAPFDVSFDIAAADGIGEEAATAADGDYLPNDTRVTIPAGSLTAQFQVVAQGDDDVENTESFRILTSNPVGVILPDEPATATLLRDDFPSLSINDVTGQEGDPIVNANDTITPRLTPFDFTVSLSEAAPFDIGVRFQTLAGTALAGEDYQPNSGLLVIPANETQGVITVEVIGDFADEPAETFLVQLSRPEPEGVSLADAMATGSIVSEPSDESVEVLTAQANDNVQLIDPDGTQATVKLSGAGQIAFFDDRGGGLDAVISGTGAANSSLRIFAVQGGNGRFDLDDVRIEQDLRQFIAPQTNVSGDLIFESQAQAGTIRLGDINSVEPQTLDLGAASDRPLSLFLGRVADVELFSATPINLLRATNWQDTDPDLQRDAIHADYIRNLLLTNEFEASLRLTGQNRPSEAVPTLAQLRAGSINGGDHLIETGSVNSIVSLGSIGPNQRDGDFEPFNLSIPQGSLNVLQSRDEAVGIEVDVDQQIRNLRINGRLEDAQIQTSHIGAAFVGQGIGQSDITLSDEAVNASLGRMVVNGTVDGLTLLAEQGVRGALIFNGQTVDSVITSQRLPSLVVGQAADGLQIESQSLIGRAVFRGSVNDVSLQAEEEIRSVVVIRTVEGLTLQTLGQVGLVNALSDTTALNIQAESLRRLAVGGDLSDSRLDLSLAAESLRGGGDQPLVPASFALRSLSVRGGVAGLILVSQGHVGLVSVASMNNSGLYAGIDLAALDTLQPGERPIFPESDVLGPSDRAIIQNLVIRGSGPFDGVPNFEDSVVAAHQVLSANLNEVLINRPDAPRFGLVADLINRLNGVAVDAREPLEERPMQRFFANRLADEIDLQERLMGLDADDLEPLTLRIV
jgi:hypothetical protein